MNYKETETTELKKTTSELKEAIIGITAILNKHQKGELYFGIRNNGTIIGQQVTENTIREISKSISDHIEPKIYPKIKEILIEEKKCIQIEFSGNTTPYYAYGRPYIRVGDENKQLSAKELEKMIIEKNQETTKWDTKTCENSSIKDINAKKLKNFLKKANLKFTTIKSGLQNLELIKNKKPLNTAILFFANNPQKFFRNTKLRCAYFPTNNTTTILDRQEHEGDPLHLIQKAEEYILKNIHIGMKLEGLYRVDVPEIDKEALREAIINAFCHRNYYDDDSIDIAIFKDRVEIRSPGLLYGGLTIQRIKKGMVSARRNNLIAELFHRIHYVERWGRGIRLILLKEPKTEFKQIGKKFIVTFKRKTTPKTTLKTTLKTQEQILEIITQNNTITKENIAKTLNLTTDGIKYHIKKLRKKGILEWKGSTKTGHWETTNTDN